jgi:hypothetical protein
MCYGQCLFMLHALQQWQKTVTSAQQAELMVLAGVLLMLRRILLPASSGSVFQDEWLSCSPPQHIYWRRCTAMSVIVFLWNPNTTRDTTRGCVCVRARACVCACVRVCVSNLRAVVCYYWNISKLECMVFQKIKLRSSVIIFLLCRCVSIVAKSACRVFVMPVPLSACISTTPTVGISAKFDFWNFVKFFREDPVLLKIGHGYRALYMRT